MLHLSSLSSTFVPFFLSNIIFNCLSSDLVALWVSIIPLELNAACILMLECGKVGLLGLGRYFLMSKILFWFLVHD